VLLLLLLLLLLLQYITLQLYAAWHCAVVLCCAVPAAS
jgi:hypothetical protein